MEWFILTRKGRSQKFNYFNDLNAPYRVGRFIQTFMNEVLRTNDMEYSLEYSVKKYIEENNIVDDFFCSR